MLAAPGAAAGSDVNAVLLRTTPHAPLTPPPHSHTRFNLLREEGEGYAKLLTLLNQQGGGKLEMDRVPAAVRGGGGGGGGTSVRCGDPAMGMGGYFS